ncbi:MULTISPECIES: EamA family transporter [Vibrio]|nr:MULTISPECIES: EamA family transporter [Vibrio]SJN22305.1 Permease of the drug/metabolite transporter (DMT) superfamily [Vibrio casei]
MNARGLALILLVVFVWGINFVIITIGIKDVPPFLLAGLRFSLVAFPLMLFLPKPTIPFRWLFSYGITMSFGQFSFLFYALYVGMPSGQASLLLQMQVFVTAILGVLIYQDTLNRWQLFGGIMALTGIGLLLYGVIETDISILGYLLTFCAACSWGVGNICNRHISIQYKGTNMLQLVVWGALIPIIPFFTFSLLFEDHQHIIHAITEPSLTSILALLYLSIVASLFGYSVWGMSIAKYGTANVVPFALLVPVIGLLSGWVILDEILNSIQFVGCAVIIIGLCVYSLNQKLIQWLQASRAEPNTIIEKPDES